MGPLSLLTMLDGRTLFIAGALIAGLFTPVMLATKYIRKTYAGFGKWAAAEIAFAVLFFLQAIRGMIGDFVPVVVGNLVACVAMILLVEGMHEFTGEKTSRTWSFAFSGAFALAMLYFYYVHEDLRIRTVLISAYLSVMAIYAALPVMRRAPEGRVFGYRFASIVLLFGVALGIVRAVAEIRMPAVNTMFTERPTDTAFFLFDLMFIIGIAFSFFLLTNERALADLRASNRALAHEVDEREKAEMILRTEVAERRRLEAQLKELVTTDELTGALNRRGLFEVLLREVQRADRLDHPLTVLEFDMDCFKEINDTYGHAAGDRALILFVETCRKNIRTVDTVGRIGGEEFAVILPETDEVGAAIVAEKLRQTLADSVVQYGDSCFSVTVSVGIASWAGGDASGKATLTEADRALYKAKQAGRNCVRVAQPRSRGLRRRVSA